jgi:hypothetical protein
MIFLRVVLSLVVLAVGMGCEQSFADGQTVNNIWWNLILNWNNSGSDICFSEQYNSKTLVVSFDVYPGDPARPTRPIHGTSTQTMAPFKQYKIYRWPTGNKPNPQCTLKSWH